MVRLKVFFVVYTLRSGKEVHFELTMCLKSTEALMVNRSEQQWLILRMTSAALGRGRCALLMQHRTALYGFIYARVQSRRYGRHPANVGGGDGIDRIPRDGWLCAVPRKRPAANPRPRARPIGRLPATRLRALADDQNAWSGNCPRLEHRAALMASETCRREPQADRHALDKIPAISPPWPSRALAALQQFMPS